MRGVQGCKHAAGVRAQDAEGAGDAKGERGWGSKGRSGARAAGLRPGRVPPAVGGTSHLDRVHIWAGRGGDPE